MLDSTKIEIEKALKLHINYNGNPSTGYLKIMDRLAYNYAGSKAEKVSKLLNVYFKEIGVSSLDEALERLRTKEKN